MMHPLSTTTFIIKRLADDWKLLLGILFGITVATGLIAGVPVYVQSLERQGINTAIDRSSEVFLDLFIFGPRIPLNRSSLDRADQSLDDSIQRHASEIFRGRRQYVKAPIYLVGLPGLPLSDEPEQNVSRGYFQYLENMEHHVEFLEGRMATDVVAPGPRGPIVEAVLGVETAEEMGVGVGDVVTLTPSIRQSTHMSAEIVGIVEAKDLTAEYWQGNALVFIRPGPLEEPVEDPEIIVNPDEPPLALFITEETMIEGVGKAYPGTLVNSSWFILVDKEALKGWSISEARSRIDALQNELSGAMQRATVFTGIKKLLTDFERRSFFASVPLLLLLTIMVMTVLYYLAMMVSYLVQSREADVAMLRSRGISTLQLVRLYSLEGLVLTGVAVVVAPFLAIGAVAASGKLPYFREITGGDLLPVEFHWMPFLFAAGAGILSLAIFVIPGVVGARTSLVIHKLRSSRPPSVPLFQRYYLDIGLLALGGLVFWELRAKGQLVSGGLFKDVEVNEALLLAPVLFLTVVALLFLRFFPLFVRFISGESPGLLHLMGAATVVTLASAIVVREVRDENELAWLAPVVLLVALTAAYWGTHRARHFRYRLGGMALQAVLVAAVVVLEPPASGEASYFPTIGLLAIVPAQALFILLQHAARIAPVWVSMGLWHMARNPLQYSWLMLLLVMVTGLGLLATRVGGTLERSHEERILYDVAADIRITDIPAYIARGREALKERYLSIPGVTSVSLALRGSGDVGATARGRGFEVLALESRDFPYISWYRDDFSDRPLTGVMRALQSNVTLEPVAIPEGATAIGIWSKPEELYQNISLWMVIQDSRGILFTLSLGPLGDSQWQLMRADLPSRLVPPLELVSVQLSEPGFGHSGTPGAVLLDDIHVTIGPDGEQHSLEDFEGRIEWDSLATSMISSDSIAPTAQDVYEGDRAVLFSFGKDTDRGIRGFYHSPDGGAVPIVASSSFVESIGATVGDALIVNIMGRLIPVVIRDTVDYFPTLNPHGAGFVLADLDGLLKHINMVSPLYAETANEIFIAEAPGAGESVREAVSSLTRSTLEIRDKDSLLESVRLDPLVTAGWKAMVLLSLAIIVFTAGLGYVTYLLSFAANRRSEMGFLQSLGLSGRQMSGLLALEHLVIVVIGLGLGSWAGLEMGRRMVSSVAVTEKGDAVVPPFILMTDWSFLLPIYGALIALFLVALYGLNRSMGNLDMHTVSRLEEN